MGTGIQAVAPAVEENVPATQNTEVEEPEATPVPETEPAGTIVQAVAIVIGEKYPEEHKV